MYQTSGAYFMSARTSRRETVVVDAWRDGQLVPGGADLPVGVDGSSSVTDTTKPGVRRQLSLGLTPQRGLFDLLSPTGTELRVRSVLRYPNGATESVPMGVFDVESAEIGYAPGGAVSIQASDKWVKIQRARFLTPKASKPGYLVTEQIIELIHEVFGLDEIVVSNVTSTAQVGSLVWEDERDKAIIELAESIGAWVYFDRNGVATIDPLPVGDPPVPVWTVDAGDDGVMLSASRSRDRSKTYNVVVVNSEVADGTPLFDPQIVWDQEPDSPTYAGTDPTTAANVGPFGIVTYRYTSPLVRDSFQAQQAGLTILTRVKGLAAQLSLTAVRNHALDAMDSISVVLPGEGFRAAPVVERHRIDKLVHPLTPGGAQAIETRSTRTDDT